jgi:zinc transport system permease protein
LSEIVELFSFAFVQRALLAGSILAILSGIVGVITLIRKTSFYGDAVAHSSLAGVALGLWLGVYPLFTALIYAIFVAVSLPFLRSRLQLSLDNALGIILPVSMGFGVLVFSFLPGYQPELVSFLFGNLLTITQLEIILILLIFVFALIIFFLFLPRMLYQSLDEDYATILGLNNKILQRIYEVLLALIVVAGVKLLGIILINALLIIPASSAKRLSSSLRDWLILSPLISLLSIFSGIITSFTFDTPPGATIALVAGAIFLLAHLSTKA